MPKTLINWGIPREFSDTNPCAYVPKLEVEEDGARPWPSWAYELIEKHAREDIRRAVLLARHTGQRQSDVLRMSPEHIEDQGIHVVQQKTRKELWVPLHSDLMADLETWDSSPYVVTPKGEPYSPERFRAAWTRLMNETPASRIRRGLHIPWSSRIECGEAPRGVMRHERDRGNHWHVACHDYAL